MENLYILIILCSIVVGTVLDKDESGEEKSVFEEVVCKEGDEHWYRELSNGQVYCWKHEEYENLKIVHNN
tara:strand:- start:312 stop:521 length:210 start_codon:yes stop_codon:yes gene_type:complete